MGVSNSSTGSGPDLRDLRRVNGTPLSGRVALWADEDPYRLWKEIATPTLPAVHERAEAIAEFDALLEVG